MEIKLIGTDGNKADLSDATYITVECKYTVKEYFEQFPVTLLLEEHKTDAIQPFRDEFKK